MPVIILRLQNRLNQLVVVQSLILAHTQVIEEIGDIIVKPRDLNHPDVDLFAVILFIFVLSPRLLPTFDLDVLVREHCSLCGKNYFFLAQWPLDASVLGNHWGINRNDSHEFVNCTALDIEQVFEVIKLLNKASD